MGGGAATPVIPGTGFSWATIVGSKVGGPVSVYRPNTRGVPMTVSFVRRYPGGLRGLGQDSTTTLNYPGMPGDGSVTTLNYPGMPTGGGIPGYNVPVTVTDVGVSAATNSQVPWYAGPLTAAAVGASKIGQQYASYANPLYQKQTVALSPSGQVLFATNQPTTTTPGALASGVGSMLPILLIGGLMVLMLAKR